MAHKSIMALAFLGLGLGLTSCSTLTPTPETTAAAALTSGNFTLDNTQAALLIRVSHFGVSSYVGRFNDLEATLEFDANNPSAAKLRAVVKTASLDVNNPTFEKTLIGEQWLDSAAYPDAVFVLDEVSVTGANTGLARGSLTLRGVTKPVSFDVTFLAGANNPLTRKYTVGFEAKGAIKRSDFQITKLLSFAGDKFDFDTVKLEFNGEFQKARQP